MPTKKEIGSKFRKKILSIMFAPEISSEVLLDNIQFSMEDDERSRSLLFNRNYEVRFFLFDNYYLPTIQFIRENPTIDFPVVKVDQGAVQHILNGADVFVQGITSMDRDFDVNAIVIISNPQNAVLAIGKSLKSSAEILGLKGKGFLNIHYLGDSIWEGKL
ncbi:MAG: PUA domain-containing protein [Candidatus Hodarchaeales archaeon]|jgi:PUA domain protein